MSPWQQEEETARTLALTVLTQTQRNRLATAAAILQGQNGAMQLVSVGAIGCSEWPATCACFYPIRHDKTTLGLSEAQLARFEQLRLALRSAAKPEDLAASHVRVLNVLSLVNEATDMGMLSRPGRGDPL